MTSSRNISQLSRDTSGRARARMFRVPPSKRGGSRISKVSEQRTAAEPVPTNLADTRLASEGELGEREVDSVDVGVKRKRGPYRKGPCEHGVKPRSNCKVCSTCPHGRQRRQCKECGGGSICEHGRQRSHCKECGGSQICDHGRRRSECKECGGASICEHGRQRSYCKECGGASICEHGRQRYRCKECRK